MKAAVLGATGFVGSALVPALAERMDVIAVSRSGYASAAARVQPVAADALEPESLRPALDGVDVVYYLVHSLGQAKFGDVDRRAAENVAAEAGARRRRADRLPRRPRRRRPEPLGASP